MKRGRARLLLSELGVEIGSYLTALGEVEADPGYPGWEVARTPGTELQEELYLSDGQMVRRSKRAGGVEDGISNGQLTAAVAAIRAGARCV